ncbi:calcium-binding protein [Streptomyces bambusae]|uniref:calcium-binding protein n=1 Tax=Streptomyces bambusae TaxID=1550616 RepID=UPI001CFD8967|nr:calcium-binding protein [Streptomyces bambusae]MCB5164918.1 calcium-binding protein [Streptomyces bambusae]
MPRPALFTAASAAALAVVGVIALPAAADTQKGDAKVLAASINGGKPIVVGPSGAAAFTVRVKASDPTGVDRLNTVLYRGPLNNPDAGLTASGPRECTALTATTSRCVHEYKVDAGYFTHADAGHWSLVAVAYGKDDDYYADDVAATTRIQRAAHITVNAPPEPARTGKPLSVTGKLTRANWETHTMRGYSGQKVNLQFRAAGALAYTTVKTVTTDAKGELRTTATAAKDGTWRWQYAGTTSTAAVNSTGDFVDVR